MQDTRETDPRVKRTRRMLFQALEELLAQKEFETISMQDIAERSTLNRGTIYLHYKDKFALLEAMIEDKFGSLFEARMAGASGGCRAGLRQMILTVCDFLGVFGCPNRSGPFDPMVGTTVRGIVRSFLETGLKKSGKPVSCADAELRATTASWAICGTVLEWSRTRSIPADELADSLLSLIDTILFLDQAEPPANPSAGTTGN